MDMNLEFGPKEGSVVAQFRMDLEGEGETSVGNLDFLSKLPEIERHLPLVVISSVSSRAKGRVEAVNLRQPVASVILVFPNLEDFLKSVGNKGKTPNGVAIKVWHVSDLYLAGEEKKLKSLVNRLSRGKSGHQKTVWFVQEDKMRRPLTKEEKKAKKAVVRRFGLVEAKCLQDRETGLVYVVARPKKKAERGESDLTQREYFAPMLERMIDAYEDQGYTVDPAEIIEACKHSTFAQRDVGALKFGFGVVVDSPNCECRWHIDRGGSITKENSCGDSECKTKPPKRLSVLEKLKQSEVHICPDCGERMSKDSRTGFLVCPNHLRHDRRG